MRKLLILAALPLLAGCYHTTVAALPDGQQHVTFVDDSPPPLGWTSPVLSEEVALWTAGGACPAGFKVTQEAVDMGSYPHTYSIIVHCKTNAVVIQPAAQP